MRGKKYVSFCVLVHVCVCVCMCVYADIASWRVGKVVSGRFGPLLLIGFWCCISVCVFPGQLLPFALATSCMALHQIRLLPKGLGHSYMLVSSSNISFAVRYGESAYTTSLS